METESQEVLKAWGVYAHRLTSRWGT